MKTTINNEVSWTARLSIASVMFALIFMFNAANSDAFQNFGLTGQNCKACHTIFSGGTSNPLHTSHAISACSTCHAPGLTIPPPTANCAQCHLGQGLRQHHRNAGVHQCSGCHMSPETAAPEYTIPPGYAGTMYDPCDGSEERFASFTVSLDNDGDLLYDGNDPDCQPQFEFDCADGIDNDGDGFTDCNDQDCADAPGCVTPLMETNCTDSIDNDSDGFIDCADLDCSADPGCQAPPVEICTDGTDNDGDGLADCADSDCSAGPACIINGTNHLGTTCLGCHTDRSALATCSTGTNHVARVGQQVWNEVLAELGLTCSNPGGGNNSVPPADHTDREDGFLHKPGKNAPFTNSCTACHGIDLRGGVGPSCFTCHGKEWNENSPSGNTGGNVPPADHTDREDGVRHKPGKGAPFTNGCTACHGIDLRGSVAPSCYTCHGTEWNENSTGTNGRDRSGHDDKDRYSNRERNRHNDSDNDRDNHRESSRLSDRDRNHR